MKPSITSSENSDMYFCALLIALLGDLFDLVLRNRKSKISRFQRPSASRTAGSVHPNRRIAPREADGVSAQAPIPVPPARQRLQYQA